LGDLSKHAITIANVDRFYLNMVICYTKTGPTPGFQSLWGIKGPTWVSKLKTLDVRFIIKLLTL